jgi:hypothetical protein
MPHDLDITRDGELMLAHIEGQTDVGVEFLDAYMPPQSVDYVVVDSGRIIIPEDAEDDFLAAARERGLTWCVAKRW